MQDSTATSVTPATTTGCSDAPRPPTARARVPAGNGQKQPPEIDTADPNLQAIIDAWPELSEAVKAGIVAMVAASTRESTGTEAGRLDGPPKP